ncbi:MAG TPA: sugar phosphate nucleotidyltransferase [Actinomycetota bacterium]|nr:sugar phosphate nucleotidyltransferase [Actinomycetota bacterium]
MRAVVMAGGQGTRLRPLTSNQPKPMLPIVGRPMMQHILRLAHNHGFNEIVATVHFLASVVRNFFGDGSDLGLSLSYATEEEPLGTAGSVKNAAPLLDERVLVLSGDSVTDVDLTELVQYHEKKGAAVTVTLKRVKDPLEFGIVITDDEGRVERFLEKPGWGEVFSDTINTGIYVIEREVIDLIPEGEVDFSKDLFPTLLDKGFPIYGYVTDRYWADVGNFDGYMQAHRDVLDRKVQLELDGFEVRRGVWLGNGAELDPDAVVRRPVYVGENTRVEGGATLRDHTVLGRGVAVRSGAFLHRCVVHDYAYVGQSANLRGCIVGKSSDVMAGARLEEGVVVANECQIGEGAVLNPQVKVYPYKSVDPGAIVSESIVWQSGGPKGLFGQRGVAGLINIDITPENATRLALAFSSLFPKGSRIVASRDASRAARIIKRAMVAGINGGGTDCDDLEIVPSPVARFYARTGRAVGGFSVQTPPFDPASVEIQFFDDRGLDIGASVQRQLERSYYRDDVRRAFHHDIGELSFPARGREYYGRGLLESIDAAAIRARNPKIVVDYSWGAAAITGAAVLGRIGASVLSVNAGVDEERVVAAKELLAENSDALAKLVASSGAEVGALLEPGGERLRLIDSSGTVLDGRTALLAYVQLVAQSQPSPRVALPVATSRVAEAILERYGGEVVWTQISPAALMSAADSDDVLFGGDEGGGFIFPQFLAAYDALMSLVKLLELLAVSGTTLKEVVEAVPAAHVARQEVPTPWEAKGTVMRRMIERLNGQRMVTIDGVKTFRGDDWALVIPDPAEPLVRVWAEAGTPESAEALAAEFAALVEELRA